jgi:hypothetical protein
VYIAAPNDEKESEFLPPNRSTPRIAYTTHIKIMIRNAFITAIIDAASALIRVRRERSLLNSRRTRNVLISLNTEMPGKLLSIRLASETVESNRQKESA